MAECRSLFLKWVSAARILVTKGDGWALLWSREMWKGGVGHVTTLAGMNDSVIMRIDLACPLGRPIWDLQVARTSSATATATSYVKFIGDLVRTHTSVRLIQSEAFQLDSRDKGTWLHTE